MATKIIDKLNNISGEAVTAKTGKSWNQWLQVLDAAGCKKMNHREIVAVVGSTGAGPWWQQMVAVGYEQARGLRVKHQKADGFSISSSKTLAVPVAKVFSHWSDLPRRRQWLKDPEFTIRKATLNKSLRLTWIDGTTNLEVLFSPKGSGKCQVSVQHNKLANGKAALAMKRYWTEQLASLTNILRGA